MLVAGAAPALKIPRRVKIPGCSCFSVLSPARRPPSRPPRRTSCSRAASSTRPRTRDRARPRSSIGEGKILFVGEPAKARERAGRGAASSICAGPSSSRVGPTRTCTCSGIGKAREIANLRGAADAEDAAAPGEAVGRRAACPRRLGGGRRLGPESLAGQGVSGRPRARPGRAGSPGRGRPRGRPRGLGQRGGAPGRGHRRRSRAIPKAGASCAGRDGSPSGVLVDNAMELVSRRRCPALGRGPRALAPRRGRRLRARRPDRDPGRVGLRRRSRSPRSSGWPRRAPADPRLRHGLAGAAGALGRVPGPGRARRRAAGFPDRPRHQGLRRRRAREPRRGAPGGLLGRAGQAGTGRDLARAAGRDRDGRPQGRLAALDPRDRRPRQPGRARRFRSRGGGGAGAPAEGTRPRIEHAQIVAPRTSRGSGASASSRRSSRRTRPPTWRGPRSGWAPRGSPGPTPGETAEGGRRLAGGSDAPVESERPLLGFYAAVTRQDAHGKPPGGWRPGEGSLRAEALALFTSDAAFAAFEENWRGRIEAGYAADLTMLGARSADGSRRRRSRRSRCA